MKQILDLTVCGVEHLSERHALLRLTQQETLPAMLPGQFVEVRIDQTPTVFLRRPISINFVDRERNELWLMVAMIGEGTRWLGSLKKGDVVNCVLPLGNGFSLQASQNAPLLVGGAISWFVTTRSKDKEVNRQRGEKGTLIASGFIAGGALMGVASAALRFGGIQFDYEAWWMNPLSELLADTLSKRDCLDIARSDSQRKLLRAHCRENREPNLGTNSAYSDKGFVSV